MARVVRRLCDEAREKCGITMEASDWETRDLGEGAPPQHTRLGSDGWLRAARGAPPMSP